VTNVLRWYGLENDISTYGCRLQNLLLLSRPLVRTKNGCIDVCERKDGAKRFRQPLVLVRARTGHRPHVCPVPPPGRVHIRGSPRPKAR
jgi:hypothetical protein